MFRILWVACVVVCLVAAPGCRKAAKTLAEEVTEKAIERQQGGKASVDLSNNKVTIKTKDGEFVTTSGGAASIPAGFPKDVFVLKDAKILVAMSNPGGFVLSLETKDSPQNIAEQYAAEMKSFGWSEQANMNAGGQIVVAYQKEKRNANVAIAKAEAVTHVTVTVTQEKE